MGLQGLPTVQRNLAKLVKVVSSTQTEGLSEIGERGVDMLKRNTPIIEGRLRNSMSYTIDNKSIDPLGAKFPQDKLRVNKEKDIVIIGTNVVYGPKVEFLSKSGSAGYMLRSYKQLKGVAEKIIKQAFKAGGF